MSVPTIAEPMVVPNPFEISTLQCEGDKRFRTITQKHQAQKLLRKSKWGFEQYGSGSCHHAPDGINRSPKQQIEQNVSLSK